MKASTLKKVPFRYILEELRQNFDPNFTELDNIPDTLLNADFAISEGPCAFYILDCRNFTYPYASHNTWNIYGCSPEEFKREGAVITERIMEPRDIGKFSMGIKHAWKFLMEQPIWKRRNFKITIDFRINIKGKSERNLLQYSILRLDNLGNIIYILIISSLISHLKSDEDLFLTIESKEDDEHFFWMIDDKRLRPYDLNLSKREREIIKLISQGYNTKQIADKLFISFHTVKTHRKNILTKTNTKNAAELIKYSSAYRIL